MPNSLIAFQLNDQLVIVFGLTQALQAPNQPPAFVEDAAGAANIYDKSENLVAGPLTFTFIDGPRVMPNGIVSAGGNYEAPLPATFNPPVGNTYRCVFDLASPTAGVLHIERMMMVQVRSWR